MRKLSCIGLFLLAAHLGFAQSQSATMSPEETVVRETYAKVAYAVQLTAVTDAVQTNLRIDGDTLARNVTAREIHFKIDDITTGNLRDIAERSYNDYVTRPEVSDELNLGSAQVSVTEEGAPAVIQYGARGEWQKPATVTRGPLDWGGLKVGPIIAQNPGYDRYAALTVTVSYLGRSHTYKSLWMFDSSGKHPVVPIDLITGNSVLAEFVTRDVTPTALLDTRMFSTRPAVRQWLQTHQIPDGSCKDAACCLPSGQCGVTASKVSTTLQKYPARKTISAAPQGTVTPYTSDCSMYNFTRPSVYFSDTDYTQHLTGYHNSFIGFTGTCSYDNPYQPRQTACDATSLVNSSASGGDIGITTGQGLYLFHVSGHNTGAGGASGISPTASTAAAVAVRNCLGGNCSVSISITGVNIGFPSDAIWSKGYTYSNYCSPQRFTSPIIIDTDGRGFHLTSAEDGVKFDIRGDRHPIQLSWTSAGSSNAFLALDRNHNGVIDNGEELFGNFTAQPDSPDRNGFLALAQFDLPQNGGNGDGIIDERDAVWSKLVLWIDSNHDGISQKGELFGLADMGVHALSLKYSDSRRVDKYGNVFRYKAKVNPGQHQEDDPVGRVAFDVFLLQAK